MIYTILYKQIHTIFHAICIYIYMHLHTHACMPAASRAAAGRAAAGSAAGGSSGGPRGPGSWEPKVPGGPPPAVHASSQARAVHAVALPASALLAAGMQACACRCMYRIACKFACKI